MERSCSEEEGVVTVIQIHHVNLVVPSDRIDAQKDFLTGVLSFRPAETPPELARRANWFEDDDGVQVHLTVIDDQTPLDPGHVAVVLGDGHADVLQRARDAGPLVEGTGPVVNRWDPAGNRWELRPA
jgi:catechol 2,3-dioxygenase-like lactoylglutathione lyase family enzyme